MYRIKGIVSLSVAMMLALPNAVTLPQNQNAHVKMGNRILGTLAAFMTQDGVIMIVSFHHVLSRAPSIHSIGIHEQKKVKLVTFMLALFTETRVR